MYTFCKIIQFCCMVLLAENVLALIYKDPHQPGFKILRFSQSLYIFIAG